MNRLLLAIVLTTLFTAHAECQLITDPSINPSLQHQHWDASWVKVPQSPACAYGVYLFRNEIKLEQVPESFVIHVSADNRYKLYVNGKLTGLGPARSDTDNWVFETYDLADFLRAGVNTIAAEVWNFGEYRPWAQISLYTAFILQGNDEESEALNTPGSWKCTTARSIQPIPAMSNNPGAKIITGPGDQVDGRTYPWGWKSNDFNTERWGNPQTIIPGAPKGVGTHITHALVPRQIPPMELKKINSPRIRITKPAVTGNHGQNLLRDFRLKANTKYTILLDQEELVTAYPELVVSGGENAMIRISYAEALFDDRGRKVHRDSVEGLNFRGNSDIIIADGKSDRHYGTLWFRTFRYIQLEIKTGDDPLVIHDYNSTFTAYPFKEKAWFKSDNDKLSPIWETGWRTARLCANELYYDCPYYEQMQYVGDARIQALISLYVAGDDRLMRKAITDFYHSITPEGLTLSRYPTEPRQVIPTYSLFWISMLHDYFWHRDDYLFVAQYLTSIQHIIQWFENRIDPETGLLSGISYWPFVDWADEWAQGNASGMGGVPPGGQEGNSSILTLQFAMTLNQAEEIFQFFGLDRLAGTYRSMSDELLQVTRKHCWDASKELFSDTPKKESFSQHANAFAVLAGAVPPEEQALFMEKILRDTSLIQASLYFRFYVHRAAIKAGLGNKYLSMLQPWSKMLQSGLTTFAEIPDSEKTRSDCHAWSASPLYELLSTVAGIKPGSPGFTTVMIEPRPGGLRYINAGIPHPAGEISMDLKFGKDGSVNGNIILPDKLSGVFIWDHQTLDLSPGKQKIRMEALALKFKLK